MTNLRETSSSDSDSQTLESRDQPFDLNVRISQLERVVENLQKVANNISESQIRMQERIKVIREMITKTSELVDDGKITTDGMVVDG